VPHKPKFPEACRHLDLAVVSRTLAKHRLDICAAAKELGVNRTDLRRLTWHDPKLLDEAKDVCALDYARYTSAMIQDLHSSKAWRRRRGVDDLLASPLAYGHPFAIMAPAPRPRVKSNRPWSEYFLEIERQRALKRASAREDAADEVSDESVSSAGSD
jgi:hypothetical protein